MKSLAIFVDVQNIYYTTRQAYQKNFDYNTFWRQVTKARKLETAYAYATDRGDEKQRQFQNILRGIGFDVKLKPYLQRRDGTSKGDWDVGITIDVLDKAPDVDVVVILSGDGDFALLAQTVIERYGVAVEVYGVPSLTSNFLIQAASKFIPIEESLLLKR